MKVSAIIQVRDGKIVNRSGVKQFFSELQDGRHLLEATSKNTRSLSQNAYLHGVLIPEFKKALNSVGYDEVKNNDQAKLIMKSMFLTDSITNKETGEMIPYIKDTHNLTTVEMASLIEAVIKFAAENMNYQIGYPNEQLVCF